jgi:hypothetical protein
MLVKIMKHLLIAEGAGLLGADQKASSRFIQLSKIYLWIIGRAVGVKPPVNLDTDSRLVFLPVEWSQMEMVSGDDRFGPCKPY